MPHKLYFGQFARTDEDVVLRASVELREMLIKMVPNETLTITRNDLQAGPTAFTVSFA